MRYIQETGIRYGVHRRNVRMPGRVVACCNHARISGAACPLEPGNWRTQKLKGSTRRSVLALLGGVVCSYADPVLGAEPPGAESPTTLSPADKAKVVKRLVKLFFNRDFDALESRTAPDAFVYIQAPFEIPWHGKFLGRTCIRDFMSQLNTHVTILAVPEVLFYVQNETGSVFVAVDMELQNALSGSQMLTSVTAKVKVNDDGQLLKVAIISDTLAAKHLLET